MAVRGAALEFFRKRGSVQTYRVGILLDEHSREDAARQLGEIARFDCLQVAWIDFGFLGQAVKIDARS